MEAKGGRLRPLYVELYESSEERLVGGVIFEDERHYRFVYEDGLLLWRGKTMITPNSLEEIASYVEQDGKKVFVSFSRLVWGIVVTPSLLPEVEAENPEFTLSWLISFISFSMFCTKQDRLRRDQGHRQ